jgi:peptide-methionine (S)-S-oxide reductase
MKKQSIFFCIALFGGGVLAEDKAPVAKVDEVKTEMATLGSGCFWCTEAVFEREKGVLNVVSGYMGGHVKNPTYEHIIGKKTGHAECAQITFDPRIISYARILDLFWHSHNPTTLNRQGNDTGPQYRSAIFYHSDVQKGIANKSKKAVQPEFEKPVVTEITAASKFWPAEIYHQNFYKRNPLYPYSYHITRKHLQQADEWKRKQAAEQKK